MFKLDSIIGYDWDTGNIFKNWEKHKVAFFECEEVFLNKPLLISNDQRHSISEKRYLALGKNSGGKLLSISFTVRKNKIRIISARVMNRKEKAQYEN